ncbi:MAG: hypothetical protein SGILL_006950, partial [Bacillariaceae sp.]
MASPTPSSPEAATPIVTRDPRFLAGRKLIERGMATEGAVDIFATLLEEATQKYGEASVESAPAYYEYGNVLLRAAMKEQQQQQQQDEEDGVKEEEDHRQAAAEAAERRNGGSSTTATTPTHPNDDDDDQKPAAVKSEPETEEKEEEEENEDNDDDGNDADLALEMMENAYSILD